MKLLTEAKANAKTKKNLVHDEYLTTILHLAPADLSGYNMCPMASMGCKAACLNTAGRGKFDNVQKARLRKTLLFKNDTKEFFELLRKDIDSLVRKASRNNKKPVVRLNGTSDIIFERIKVSEGKNIFELYPNVQFYDYTKIPVRFDKRWQLPYNYHLTFSASENNKDRCIEVLNNGGNVAVVFRNELPNEYWSYEVVDGDKHDLRFLDDTNVIVGLKAKGKAKKDNSGFVKE